MNNKTNVNEASYEYELAEISKRFYKNYKLEIPSEENASEEVKKLKEQIVNVFELSMWERVGFKSPPPFDKEEELPNFFKKYFDEKSIESKEAIMRYFDYMGDMVYEKCGDLFEKYKKEIEKEDYSFLKSNKISQDEKDAFNLYNDIEKLSDVVCGTLMKDIYDIKNNLLEELDNNGNER